ncbi:MAG TPA: hypothetical protein VG096_10750 [Bryobacteraceae bacterium]|nr:hypothetical protein [Bryobacteraceae bacterium]
MAPTAPLTPVREILEGRLSKLALELEELFDAQLAAQVSAEVQQQVDAITAQVAAEARDRARVEFADFLNQAMRRMRQCSDLGELNATLVELAGMLASGAVLLSVRNKVARGQQARGVPAEQAEAVGQLEIPLSSAAALAEAIETHDPVTTIATPVEISEQLTAFTGQSDDGRLFIYPLVTGERVPALLCVWGATSGSALELLTQMAAAVWSTMPPPPDLVSIAGSEMPTPTAWDTLPADEQRLHLRAQRFARVQVAEMRLYETEAVQSGRARGDLYGALRERIDRGRDSFRKSFFASCPSMVDYLHLELLRTLAHDDPDVLGKDYPGPLL